MFLCAGYLRPTAPLLNSWSTLAVTWRRKALSCVDTSGAVLHVSRTVTCGCGETAGRSRERYWVCITRPIIDLP